MDNVRSVKDGVSHKKSGRSPTKRFDFPLLARSSAELKKKVLKQVKKEKIDKLHEMLQRNNRERVQEVVEVMDETPKKGTQQERVQKIDLNFDKETVTKKMERDKLSQPKVMKDHAHGDKEVVQETPKKRTHEKDTINRERVQKVDDKLDNHIDIKKMEIPKLLQPQVKEVFTHGNKEVSQELHKSKEMDATKSNNGEKPGCNVNPISSQNQPKRGTQQESVQNWAEVNEKEANTNREEEKGTSQRKTRGKTLCKKIHARTLEERAEVTFNKDGQLIGPSDKVVSDLSLFLGTLARNSTFCPPCYTNWSGMPDDKKKRFWRYTNRKFILPIEAQDWVETTVRDAWRRYKHKIKKNHFLKYSNMSERLKNRPLKVPIA